MKGELNGVDVHVLCRELDGLLSGGRFDKAYQFGGKELLVRVYRSGAGSFDVVITPKYFCASGYSRRVPEKPSSFAMQLRKVLEGGFLSGVRQRDFDRIVEFSFDVKGARYFLVAEFFSSGNVFLLDANRKILGLFEWQRWKDRTLGVGKTYEYPPAVANPLRITEADFKALMSSDKGVAAAIASLTSIGGFYAEEVCARAGVDRKARADGLSDGQLEGLWLAFRKVLAESEGARKPAIICAGGKPAEVVPIECVKMSGLERKDFQSFNAAVDEYFSLKEGEDGRASSEGVLEKKRERLDAVLRQQREALERMNAEVVEEHAKGDAIYARIGEIEEVARFIREARSKGVSDADILEQLKARGFVKGLDKFELTLEL